MIDIITTAIPALFGALVNSVWLTLLIAGLAWAALRILEAYRPVNASTRYAVWTVSLALIVTATAGLAWMRTGSISGSDDTELNGYAPITVAETSTAVEPRLPEPQALLDGLPVLSPAAGFASDAALAAPSDPSPLVSGVSALTSGVIVAAEPLAAAAPASTASVHEALQLSSFASWIAVGLLAVWFFVMGLRLVRLGIGWYQVHRIKSRASVLSLDVAAAYLPADLTRSVDVLETDELRSPVASGPIRPAVLIPFELRRELSQQECEQIILHEVAHLVRRDDWTLFLQRVVEGLFWFHPAVWWIGSRMQDERERACDEWVVSRTRRPDAYVSSIGRLLELRLGVESLALAPGLAERKSSLADRMKRVLNEKIPASSSLSARQVSIAGGLLALVVALIFLTSSIFKFSLSFADSSEHVRIDPSDAVYETQEAAPTARGVYVVQRATPVAPLAPVPPVPPVAPVAPVPPVPPVPPVAPMEPIAPAHAEPVLAGNSVSQRVSAVRAPVQPSAPSAVEPVSASNTEPLSADSWIKLLKSASGISSSSDKSRVLQTAAARFPDEARVYDAFIEAASSIPSSSSRAEALRALLDRREVQNLPFNTLILASGEISSTSESASLLVRIITVAPNTDSINSTLLDAAEGITSSSARADVLRSLAERDRN